MSNIKKQKEAIERNKIKNVDRRQNDINKYYLEHRERMRQITVKNKQDA